MRSTQIDMQENILPLDDMVFYFWWIFAALVFWGFARFMFRLLQSIPIVLLIVFSLKGDLRHLENAIRIQRALHAVALSIPGISQFKALSTFMLADLLHVRLERLSALADLDEGIVISRNALQLCPPGHPLRYSALVSLARYLHSRFLALSELTDLDEAITLIHSALELTPPGDARRSQSLNRLGNAHHSRFLQLGLITDLEEAIAQSRAALDLCPTGHHERPNSLSYLGRALHSRFLRFSTMADLDEAIDLHRTALEVRPTGFRERHSSLNDLASTLHSRFQQLGAISDLDEAISLYRSAMDLRPPGHRDRPTTLNNLANALHSRFQHFGATTDLDEAITLHRTTLELCPVTHPLRSLSLSSLASTLHSRFGQLSSMADLDEAIVLNGIALELVPTGHLLRSSSLHSLAISLYSRFQQLSTMTDLDEAISLHREAVGLRPVGHPLRPASLISLASCLHSRFQRLGVTDDVEEAIALQRASLQLCPNGHPVRSTSLQGLAQCLHSRFDALGVDADLEEGFDHYLELVDISESHTASSVDLDACKAWVDAAERFGHKTTIEAYRTYLRLLANCIATLPSLPRHHDLLKKLASSLAVDAFSACIRYGALTTAVELLEQGRGIFWNQLLRLRSPLDEVRRSEFGRILAEEYTRLTSLIRNTVNSPPDLQHDQVCHLNVQLQGVVSDIRRIPDLSRFLLPPLFLDLQEAASGGPVVIINASKYGCDGLIILHDKDPIHVPLQITKARAAELSLQLHSITSLAKVRDVKRDLVVILRELWDVVVFPVAKRLQAWRPRRSRIWWCPTAQFLLLPLHAAGAYRKGGPNLSDLYISSHIPSLTALIRARQPYLPSYMLPTTTTPRFVVVGQAKAPGEKQLFSVNAELAAIVQRLESVATVTCIQDQYATIARVSDELRRHELVHLACHGIPNPQQPFDSAFALRNGHLTIDDIMRYDMKNARFAFLSACHTAVGDEQSPDEVIHLAAAMQFAGFRSVIGTMWAVDDSYANDITSAFYGHMINSESGELDYTRAALALHKTMRSLAKIPFDQRILYIHIGA